MKLENIILLMGPPGSGKGTQGKLLTAKTGYAFFSMGDTLREYTASGSELGMRIKNIIDTGSAVPDEIATEVFEESFEKRLNGTSGVIIDGYPRSLGQVESLNKVLAKLQAFKVSLILLDVDKKKLIDRLILRSKAQGRADDADIASIEKRFDEYNNKTSTAKNYYEGRGETIHINGDQPIETVHQEILSKLGI